MNSSIYYVLFIVSQNFGAASAWSFFSSPQLPSWTNTDLDVTVSDIWYALCYYPNNTTKHVSQT